jgi:hypothetical protein
MMQFICAKKIGLISRNTLSPRIIRKNNLKLELEKIILLDNKKYYIYIFEI